MPRIDQYLQITAAADYLGVSPNTLRRWADEGAVRVHVNPANQYRLFSTADLDAFLRALATPSRSNRKPR